MDKTDKILATLTLICIIGIIIGIGVMVLHTPLDCRVTDKTRTGYADVYGEDDWQRIVKCNESRVYGVPIEDYNNLSIGDRVSVGEKWFRWKELERDMR